MGQFWRHPQLEARGRWAKVGSPSGELEVLKPPFNLSGFEPRIRDPVPALGEHTAAILGELGYATRKSTRSGAQAPSSGSTRCRSSWC